MYRYEKIIGTLLVLMFIFSGCGKTESIPELTQQEENSFIEYEADRRDLTDIRYCEGYVHAVQYEQYFNKEGIIEEVYVNTGDKVQKGDLLAKIYCADAKKQLKSLQKQKEFNDKIRENRISQGEIQITLKKREINSMMKNGTGEEEVAMSRLELEELEENLRYDKVKAEIETKRSVKSIAKLQEGMKDDYLYATESGIVSYVHYFPDAPYITTDRTAVVISSEEESYVEPFTPVTEQEAAGYKSLFAYVNGEKYNLDYKTIRQDINGTETRCVQFTFQDGKTPELGYDALIGMVNRSVKDSVTLPEQAINQNGQNYYVYMEKGKQKEKVPITIGLRFNGVVEIKSGLEEGDKVYAYGGATLTGTNQEETVSYGSLEDVHSITKVGFGMQCVKTIMNQEEDATLVKFYIGTFGTFKKGDKLYKIRYNKESADALTIENEMRKLKENYESQKKALRESMRTINLKEETSALQSQLLTLELEQLEAQYNLDQNDCQERYKEAIEHSGEKIIYAPMDGYIVNLCDIEENSTLPVGQVILSIGVLDEKQVSNYDDNVTFQYGCKVNFITNSGKIAGKIVSSAKDYDHYSGNLQFTSYGNDKAAIELSSDISAFQMEPFEIEYCSFKIEKGIIISTGYLFQEEDKTYVWVKKDGYLQKRYIVVGKRLEEKSWIVDGLSEGEVIVTNQGTSETAPVNEETTITDVPVSE